MRLLNSSYEQDQAQSDARDLSMRLMCAGHETEIELVKKELFKAGITSETRRHPLAEALGVSGVELWVQNEQDFFNASKVYTRLQGKAPSTPPPTPKPQISVRQPEKPGPASKDASKVESRPVVQQSCLELKEASSLLQKGIEEMLLRESELANACTSLQGKVEELSQALGKAQADVAREIKGREAAERKEAEQVTGLLDTLARERKEWQEKLKSSDDSFKNAKEQVTSLSRLLQNQQAAATALKQELAALEIQRDQQERALSEARNETAAEREARVAAEERAGVAEQSLETQWIERQDLERQLQTHAASLGSLLAKVTSKAGAGSAKP